jgi:hypothetical protein
VKVDKTGSMFSACDCKRETEKCFIMWRCKLEKFVSSKLHECRGGSSQVCSTYRKFRENLTKYLNKIFS